MPMPSREVLLIDPGDSAVFEVEWDEYLGAATLSSVTHTLPSPLTKVSESTDAPNKRSLVRISGAVHGATYLCEAAATLSTGEIVNRKLPLRCFNG